jgi:bile acid-coenzyme A ligase
VRSTMTATISYSRQISELAGRHPDEVAVVHAKLDGTERSVTWAELDRRSNQVARMFQSRGAGQGDTVVIALLNSAEHFFCTIGAWKLGATVLPMRWDLPPWERGRLLDLAAAKIVVATWEEEPLGSVSLADVDASEREDAGELPDAVADPARKIATSGSTGRPKLIVTPSPGVIGLDPMVEATNNTRVREGATQLVISPLYHTNGFASLNGLLESQKLVVMERFDAARAVDLIEAHRINTAITVPTMLQRIAELPGVTERDFSSVDAILYGGAPLPPWVARRWFELVGPEHFFFSYGGTEGIGLTMARGDEWLTHEGTCGRPVGCEVRILDAERRELPPHEVGDIFMRRLDHSTTFVYVGADMPETTVDGFRSFGDLGSMDEGGYLYIADRRLDMVITGGANVYPAEVELALSEHKQVADVVVIGLPDPEWGQRVHAVIEPVDAGDPPRAEDLRAFARSRLAAYKVPKSFEMVERIQRSAAGKVNRSALIAERAVSGAEPSSPAAGS